MAEPTTTAIAGAVTAISTAVGGIFGSKQKAKLAEAEAKKSTVEGILALKQQQIEQQREQQKQQAQQQFWLFVCLIVAGVLIVAGIIIYKISLRYEPNPD